ncbi:MAG: ATP-binding protein [Thermoplasmatota archaeon]
MSGGTHDIREVLEALRDTFGKLDIAVAEYEALLSSGIRFTINRTGTFTTLRRGDTTLPQEGASFLSVIAAEDKKKAARIFMECLEGKHVQTTLRLADTDGSQMTVMAGPTGDGAVHGIALAEKPQPDAMQEAIHQVDMPLAVVDLVGNIVAVNTACAAFLSRDVGAATGTNLFEYVHPEDEAAVRACMKGAMAGDGQHVSIRLSVDDRELPVIVDIAAVDGGDGVLVHFVEQQAATAPAASAGMVPDDVETFMEAAIAMTHLEENRPRQDLYEQAVELVHTHLDDADSLVALGEDGALVIAAGDGTVDDLPTDMHFKIRETLAGNGEQYERDADGRSELYLPVGTDGIAAVLVVTRDGVDAFSQMEQVLLRLLSQQLGRAVRQRKQVGALQKYEGIIKKAVEGIYRATTKGDILEVNPAFLQMFRYEGYERELEELTVSDLYMHPEKRETFLELLQQEGIVRDFEAVYVTRDRDTFYGRESAWVATEGDRQVVVGIIQDITTQKKTEEDIRFYNSLLRHDIYNKHQVAIGYLGLTDKDSLAAKDNEALSKAMAAIDEANKLIETVKKLEMVKDTEQLDAIDLDGLISRVADHYAGAAEERDIDIHHPPSGAVVQGTELLEDVFSNLVKNAIQHAYADNIGIYARETDDGWRVYVEDDGVGIPDEAKNKIFQQGWKGRKSTGSGLGLYLVKKIVEECGGSISVESGEDEYPEGTRFVLHLKKGEQGTDASNYDSPVMGIHW